MAAGLRSHPALVGLDGSNAEHRDDKDDLENRQINAPEIHGVYLKWAFGGGAGHGADGAL